MKPRDVGAVCAYPRVVMVTMVYQNDAGMEVNVESTSLCNVILNETLGHTLLYYEYT